MLLLADRKILRYWDICNYNSHDSLFEEKKPTPKGAIESQKEEIVKTNKSKRRVAILTKLAIKGIDNWTKWERKFFEGMRV